ncbi:hypothetical protein [Micromonospora sp. WMMD1082]|uniref:hypothetical protein n=1 Tax=Micromonospora sp. WMMD1082 TaxID=3016104 RepID=UPI00241606EF|nr:hypothetical protein [Micromonospora sp. WMMD1082]MDG4795055.1 hypothetical protein [Micromonospora sp. WMMD1082]
MPARLWFHLQTVQRLATLAATARCRVDVDSTVAADVPPALHLMREKDTDRLYIDGNFHPSLTAALDINAEPFRRTRRRRYVHGITWTQWLGGPLRRHRPVQARVPLTRERHGGGLVDLLRAGHTAGFDMLTIDVQPDGDLRVAVARRRPRTSLGRRAPRAGASPSAPAAQAPPYTSSYPKRQRQSPPAATTPS